MVWEIWFKKSGSRKVADQKKRWIYTINSREISFKKSKRKKKKILVWRTTFLEPLFYTFLEKWLQNKWPTVSLSFWDVLASVSKWGEGSQVLTQGLLNENFSSDSPNVHSVFKNLPWVDSKLYSSFWEIQKFWHLILLPEPSKLKYICCNYDLKVLKFSNYCLEALVNPVTRMRSSFLSPFKY